MACLLSRGLEKLVHPKAGTLGSAPQRFKFHLLQTDCPFSEIIDWSVNHLHRFYWLFSKLQ